MPCVVHHLFILHTKSKRAYVHTNITQYTISMRSRSKSINICEIWREEQEIKKKLFFTEKIQWKFHQQLILIECDGGTMKPIYSLVHAQQQCQTIQNT